MKKIISFYRQDHCVNCNRDRSIELYDVYDKPINYPYYLDNKDKISLKVFDKKQLSYMKCKKCDKMYMINWENKIPEPLINKNTMFLFINKTFKKQ